MLYPGDLWCHFSSPSVTYELWLERVVWTDAAPLPCVVWYLVIIFKIYFTYFKCTVQWLLVHRVIHPWLQSILEHFHHDLPVMAQSLHHHLALRKKLIDFSVSVDLPAWDISYKWNHIWPFVTDWVNTMFSRFICAISASLLFMAKKILRCMDIPHFFHPFISCCTFGCFPPFSYNELWILMYEHY